MVVFGQKWFYLGKKVVFGKKWLYSGKVVVFGKSGCLREKWLYSGRVDVFLKKWFCLGEKVVFGQRGCFRAKEDVFGIKLSYSGKSGRIRAMWLYSGKSCCIWAKVVVFEQE